MKMTRVRRVGLAHKEVTYSEVFCVTDVRGCVKVLDCMGAQPPPPFLSHKWTNGPMEQCKDQ